MTAPAEETVAELMELAQRLAAAEHARLSARKGDPTMNDVRLHAERSAARYALELAIRAALTAPDAGLVLAPAFRGYAHLGIGAYLLNHSKAGEPPELVISIATEEEKAGREVGDDAGNADGAAIQPEVMAVRLRFENVAGLDALEKQLRSLREEHFGAAPARVPLTEEQIDTIQHEYMLKGVCGPHIFVRMIEAAHGITPAGIAGEGAASHG